MLTVRMLDIIVCPLCRGKMRYISTENELVCNTDRLAFPVKGDIPILLKEEARLLDENEL